MKYSYTRNKALFQLKCVLTMKKICRPVLYYKYFSLAAWQE